ncbi:MAG: twin-arginine translocation signal domain-containing protein [candidate division WOR-3 bacterium]|nr:MAG: twin-arginine translocation signal domain-containing protein [candidate division WOR-3 bacterium]
MNDISRRDFMKHCSVGASGVVLRPNIVCIKSI